MHFHSAGTFSRSEAAAESLMNAVNKHMRKVNQAEGVQLHRIAPLAIRCALKNLVPYSLVSLLRYIMSTYLST